MKLPTKKIVSDLSEKLQETKKRFKAFDEGYRSLEQNRVYRVIQPESNSTRTSALKENELMAVIADALWEMMTEFDKDEIIRKKIIREL